MSTILLIYALLALMGAYIVAHNVVRALKQRDKRLPRKPRRPLNPPWEATRPRESLQQDLDTAAAKARLTNDKAKIRIEDVYASGLYPETIAAYLRFQTDPPTEVEVVVDEFMVAQRKARNLPWYMDGPYTALMREREEIREREQKEVRRRIREAQRAYNEAARPDIESPIRDAEESLPPDYYHR